MRPLNQREIKFLEPIFGTQITYEKVRIIDGGGINFIANIVHLTNYDAIVMGNKIYVKKCEFRDDYCENPTHLGFFAHEMTHVWQYQNALKMRWLFKGISIAINSLIIANPYDISGLNEKSDFNRLGFEQQAMVVQKYAEALYQGDVKSLSFFGNILTKGGLLA